jgi:hypothetical protein
MPWRPCLTEAVFPGRGLSTIKGKSVSDREEMEPCVNAGFFRGKAFASIPKGASISKRYAGLDLSFCLSGLRKIYRRIFQIRKEKEGTGLAG